MEQREIALSKRHMKRGQELTEHTKVLKPLEVSQTVSVQNQRGNKPNRWDQTGLVVEVKGYDQYVVMMDGSRDLSKQNRKFLHPIQPFMKKTDTQTPRLINAAVGPKMNCDGPLVTLQSRSDVGVNEQAEKESSSHNDMEVDLPRRSERSRHAPDRLGF